MEDAKNFMNPHDFKIGLFTENKKTYMSMEYIENNQKIIIHKIDLSRLIGEKETQTYIANQSIYFSTNIMHRISIPTLANNDGEIYTVIDLEPKPKEMTKEDIEKELGYSIKIKGVKDNI